MCGIWALFGKPLPDIKPFVEQLRNRGPEETRVIYGTNFQFGFTRLAINGGEMGMQPFEDSNLVWMCNGEIYNYKELAIQYNLNIKSGSDCEVIGGLYSLRPSFASLLDGVFASVVLDKNTNLAVVTRDPYGVRPLYMSISPDRIIFASEVKALPVDSSAVISVFPPGQYATVDTETRKITFTKYNIEIMPEYATDNHHMLRDLLTTSVLKRLMTGRPIAALLSGGLDSSLVAALLQGLSTTQLKTFSIGFAGSEDLRCAKLVADHIGSDHTEIIMTADDFFAAIPEVIYDISSFDITTVRASVGNWLLGREISRRCDSKVVFNGDGSDEIFGGYLYFHKAPSDSEFIEERNRLIDDIHHFDVLRSDRCISSHGLEPRTPFLDKALVSFVKGLPASILRPVGKQEKHFLRSAFASTGLLPPEILWRKKEAFSDGVSGEIPWYCECQLRAEKLVPNWKEDSKHILYMVPQTAEAYYYRKVFNEKYGHVSHLVPYFWMPKWSPETTDPSARTLQPTTVNAS